MLDMPPAAIGLTFGEATETLPVLEGAQELLQETDHLGALLGFEGTSDLIVDRLLP